MLHSPHPSSWLRFTPDVDVILGKSQQQDLVTPPTSGKPLCAPGSESSPSSLGVSEEEAHVALFFLLNVKDLLLPGPLSSTQSQIT